MSAVPTGSSPSPTAVEPGRVNIALHLGTATRARSRRRRLITALATMLLALFMLSTLRLFVFPTIDRPSQADAIFMLEGSGDRRALAFELAKAGYAPVLVVSTPGTKRCPVGEVPNVELICFAPDPSTTQGEAREAERLATRYGWKKVIFITDRSQDTRARLRIGRCYDGEVLVTTVDPPLRNWPYLIAYQWAALGKALLLQRGC